MSDNHLVLSGQILRIRHFETPAGIAHSQITLAHESQRAQAGMMRRVYCQIQVILSGDKFSTLTDRLKAGVEIQVQGFVSMQQNRNGQNRILLHAEHVELKP